MSLIFFGSKRNAKRSHFPPSRTKTDTNGAPYLKAVVHIFRNEFLESNWLDYNIYGTAHFQYKCKIFLDNWRKNVAKLRLIMRIFELTANYELRVNRKATYVTTLIQELGTEETTTALERIMRMMTGERIMRTMTAERIMRTMTAERIMRTMTAERIMRMTTTAERIMQLTH